MVLVGEAAIGRVPKTPETLCDAITTGAQRIRNEISDPIGAATARGAIRSLSLEKRSRTVATPAGGKGRICEAAIQTAASALAGDLLQ